MLCVEPSVDSSRESCGFKVCEVSVSVCNWTIWYSYESTVIEHDVEVVATVG